ncbi:MAG: hypothetical protein JWM59_746 [Verrucomicrobiales bacterium]|nr:hypothetical protein [Verrucomicrobiales bacterium]
MTCYADAWLPKGIRTPAKRKEDSATGSTSPVLT